MEPTEVTSEIVLYKGVQDDSHKNIMEATKAELAMAKEELKIAKESVIQSWLDSEPLVDELEMQKSNLATAQQRSKISNTDIKKLESQLETIHKSIKSKREDQFRTELMIHDVNRALDQTRNEVGKLKFDRKKEMQAQRKLRQALYIRRQTVKKLQLTLQAILLELDAVKESTAKALEQINHSETYTADGHLTHEDYYSLTKKAKEKITKADRHVTVSMEQKLAAEGSYQLALSRLNRYYSSKSSSMNRRHIIGQQYTEQDAKKQDAIVKGEVTTNRGIASSTKSHSEPLTKSDGGKLQQPRRPGSKIKITMKKLTIFYKLKKCLLHVMKNLSG